MTILLSSLWLGILTSISPCPLISNITAVSFIGQKSRHPLYALLSGIAYTLGRAALYIVLGLALSLGIGSLTSTSQFFQSNIYYILSPLMVIIGLVLLNVIKIKTNFNGLKKHIEKFPFLTKGGFINSFVIGVLFASAFCPISGALFFGNLIQNEASVTSLLAYGIGTGLPVMLFAVIIAFSAHNLARVYKAFEKFEVWARKITGLLFIVTGFYSANRYLGISFNVLTLFTMFADFVTYDLFKLVAETRLAQALHFFIDDTLKILFLLFSITSIISYFRAQLQPEKVREYLEGKPKWLAYLMAAIFGAITPFCSCSSIPLFIGFIEAGIPFGVTMSFLISSPMINEVAIVIFAGIIGWKLTVLYVITGMVVGIVGGMIMEKLGWEKYVEGYVYDIKMGKLPRQKHLVETVKQRLAFAFDYSSSLVKKVWFYIIIAVAIGSVLHGYVPQEFFIQYLGADNFFAVPVAVLVGIPLYGSDTGIIPIAEVLINKGVPIGTVLALMMSVVAISLPELIILRKVLKTRLLAYFVILLFFAFIIVGYLYNLLF